MPTQKEIDAIDARIAKVGALPSWRNTFLIPNKECPSCHERCESLIMVCPGCGHGFYHAETRERATRDEMNERILTKRNVKITKEVKKCKTKTMVRCTQKSKRPRKARDGQNTMPKSSRKS